jgi:hypothetical protein
VFTGDDEFGGVIFGVVAGDSAIDRLLDDGNLILVGAGYT